MSANKKPNLVTLPTIPVEANKQVVETLTGWLEAAKAGRIISIAMCAITPDRKSWTYHSQTDQFALLTGAIVLMQHRRLNQFTSFDDEGSPIDPTGA